MVEVRKAVKFVIAGNDASKLMIRTVWGERLSCGQAEKIYGRMVNVARIEKVLRFCPELRCLGCGLAPDKSGDRD